MTQLTQSGHKTKPEGVESESPGPSWDALHATAEAQQGVFTSEQAAEAGFSSQLLNKHLHSGNLERVHARATGPGTRSATARLEPLRA